MTTLTYELTVTSAQAVEHPRPLATLRDEVHIAEKKIDTAGALAAATLNWIKRSG